MKKLLFSALLFATALSYFSCQKTDPGQPTGNAQQATSPGQRYVILPETENDGPILGRIDGCFPEEVMLVAGQTIDAGTVTVTNNEAYIFVTYTTTNDWKLAETHLYVGDCALIPVNNPGNPIPGQFPYSSTHNNITSYTYQIPISQIPAGSCGCIAAHAVVKQYNSSNQVINTQTGWGNGVRINLTGGNWGMKFDYCSCTPE